MCVCVCVCVFVCFSFVCACALCFVLCVFVYARALCVLVHAVCVWSTRVSAYVRTCVYDRAANHATFNALLLVTGQGIVAEV